jgi:hypothetical protein
MHFENATIPAVTVDVTGLPAGESLPHPLTSRHAIVPESHIVAHRAPHRRMRQRPWLERCDAMMPRL